MGRHNGIRKDVFKGSNGDSPLLPQSYEEIKAFGKKVKYVPFKAIYSSTAKRARDTAEGINKELARPVEIFIQIS